MPIDLCLRFVSKDLCLMICVLEFVSKDLCLRICAPGFVSKELRPSI